MLYCLHPISLPEERVDISTFASLASKVLLVEVASPVEGTNCVRQAGVAQSGDTLISRSKSTDLDKPTNMGVTRPM